MPDLIADAKQLRAAQYVRMSTEHQQYSTTNQIEAIGRYAKGHNMEVVRSFIDAGKSGVRLARRYALQELIQIVEKKQADFDVILVYDVSRWGRFQDIDESAYYEYICKRANIRVRYCEEPFENDDSTFSNLLKALKRTMAGEYSRELSNKVFTGHCRLVERGFHQGSPPGYGFRRQLVDSDGNFKKILQRGEMKSIHTDRVILVPGLPREVKTVREIFSLFTDNHMSEAQIAASLNSRGIVRDIPKPWNRDVISRMLTNPKYIGMNLYNRRSRKLGLTLVRNPPDTWVSRSNAFEPIVSPDQFARAQAIFREREKKASAEGMLTQLRQLLEATGRLSISVIDAAPAMPAAATYARHFGSLSNAYRLIQYVPRRDQSYVQRNSAIRKLHKQHSEAIAQELRNSGALVEGDDSKGFFTINREFTVLFIVTRCRRIRNGEIRWMLNLASKACPDIVTVGRLANDNKSIVDYYFFPDIAHLYPRFRLAPQNTMLLDACRARDLGPLIKAARRAPLLEAMT